MSAQMSAEVETDVQGGGRELPTGMLERITQVLDAFDRRSIKLNLEEVVRRMCLPRSTTHRILEQLVSMEWLQRDHPEYGFGRRALGLERMEVDLHTDQRQAAEPYLHGLRMRTGMVVLLSVLEGAEEVVLDKLGGHHASSMEPTVGRRSAAHISAGGRWTPGARVASVIRTPEGLLAAISLCSEPGGGGLDHAAPLVLSAAQRVSFELCQQDASALQSARNS